jgi:hypothetical protein
MSGIVQQPNRPKSEITPANNRLKSEITLVKDAYQLAFESNHSVVTRAQWLASFAVSGPFEQTLYP